MIIDCERCEMRNVACDDCVVTALLGAVPEGDEIGSETTAALRILADGGLVPPLRMRWPDAASG